MNPLEMLVIAMAMLAQTAATEVEKEKVIPDVSVPAIIVIEDHEW